MANSKRARERKRKAVQYNARKRRHQNAIVNWSIAGAAVLLFTLLAYNAFRPRPGDLLPDLGNQHIQPPAKAVYNSSPPTSGPHYSGIAPWGIHDSPIPDALQVHNLEDGGVMVQYSCPEGCDELVSQLTALVEGYDHEVILAPYPDMAFRIALTAWNRLETLDEFDESRIIKFINEYRGRDHHV